jgi:hypothetical protein
MLLRRPRRAPSASIVAALVLTLAAPPAAAQPAAPPPPGAAPAAKVIVPPTPLTPLEAEYPEGASGDATVLLVITINADGSVRAARPAEGAEEPFASAAVKASTSWLFQPATEDGKAIATKIRAEIRFHAPAPPEPALIAPIAPIAPATAASSTASAAPPAPPPPPPLEVTVHGQQPAPGVASFTRAEVRLLPGAFGDPFRAIDMLPGVTPLASGLPYFYVRGAPPGNVGYFLDGIRVPLLYHIGLGPSVIHPAIVDRVDLYPGGYPASFGRYAGGVVSGETREPLPEWHGEANIRLVDAGAMLSGPFDEGRGSFFVAGRYSYTALLLSLISSNINLGYWDYQARVSYRVTPRDELTLFAFGARDFLSQRDDPTKIERTLFNTTFHRLDLRYDHRFGGPEDHVRQAVTLGYDVTGFDLGAHVTDKILGARTEITKRATPAVLVRAGLDMQLDVYENNLTPAFGEDASGFANSFPSGPSATVGVRGDAVITVTPRLEVTPGVRVDLFSSKRTRGPLLTEVTVDPRLSSRFAVTPALRIITALGLASQAPSFILPGPGFQLDLKGGLQRSFQTSLGVEADLPWDLTGIVTGFHNAFFNMTDALGTNPPPGSGSDFPSTFDARSLGSSLGLELTLRRRLTRRLGGFISYTLSRSERYVGRSTIASAFDRTHVFNAATSFDFGRGYKAGTRLMFYTGYPITSAVGDQVRETGRLPPFFRFDARAEKRWPIGKRGWISLVLEVANAMLAKETLQEQCVPGTGQCTPVTIGPVTIPSIGLEGGF